MRLTLALLALAFLAAGCSSPAPDAAPEATDAPAPAAPGPTHDVDLYSFDDLVVGASAPDPASGPAADPIPLAKTDTFTVANGTLALSISGGTETGSGAGRIEVYAPNGTLAWSSDTYIIAGAPGAGGVGVYGTTASAADGVPAEGAYEVRYYVSGAMQATLVVTATLSGAA